MHVSQDLSDSFTVFKRLCFSWMLQRDFQRFWNPVGREYQGNLLRIILPRLSDLLGSRLGMRRNTQGKQSLSKTLTSPNPKTDRAPLVDKQSPAP